MHFNNNFSAIADSNFRKMITLGVMTPYNGINQCAEKMVGALCNAVLSQIVVLSFMNEKNTSNSLNVYKINREFYQKIEAMKGKFILRAPDIKNRNFDEKAMDAFISSLRNDMKSKIRQNMKNCKISQMSNNHMIGELTVYHAQRVMSVAVLEHICPNFHNSWVNMGDYFHDLAAGYIASIQKERRVSHSR